MRTSIPPSRSTKFPANQDGVVLFVALIVLVAMTLAAVGLVRAVDSGTIVAGNQAFKRAATHAGDRALDAARNWIIANSNGAVLYADGSGGALGYWATWQPGVDLFGEFDSVADYDWKRNSICAEKASTNGISNCSTDPEGNRLAFVIHRLCDGPGDPETVNCVTPPAISAAGQNRGGVRYSTLSLTAVSKVIYRVTVRIEGPRNTVSYIQSSIY